MDTGTGRRSDLPRFLRRHGKPPWGSYARENAVLNAHVLAVVEHGGVLASQESNPATFDGVDDRSTVILLCLIEFDER